MKWKTERARFIMIKIYDAVSVYDKTLRFSWKLSGDCGQKSYWIRLYGEDNACV